VTLAALLARNGRHAYQRKHDNRKTVLKKIASLRD